MKASILVLALIASVCDAGLRLAEFKNESDLVFNPTFCNGTPIENAYLDQPEFCLATADDALTMVFEDAGSSGYFRPACKFHLWLESDGGFAYLTKNRFLYAVIFYDGDGEISVRWDKEGKLHIAGGVGVKDILLPWAKGTMGRGNPYHEIQGVEADENGVTYSDYQGFMGKALTLP